MATSINSLRFTAQLNWDVKDSQAFGDRTSTGTDSPASANASFSQGTGAGQADQVYLYRGTLAGGANLTIDLVGGGLVDLMGNAFTPAKLKGIYFRHIDSAGNTGTNCLVGQAAANSVVPWQIKVTRGGAMLDFDPGTTGIATVTATTADNFRVLNGDGANSVEFLLALVFSSV